MTPDILVRYGTRIDPAAPDVPADPVCLPIRRQAEVLGGVIVANGASLPAAHTILRHVVAGAAEQGVQVHYLAHGEDAPPDIRHHAHYVETHAALAREAVHPLRTLLMRRQQHEPYAPTDERPLILVVVEDAHHILSSRPYDWLAVLKHGPTHGMACLVRVENGLASSLGGVRELRDLLLDQALVHLATTALGGRYAAHHAVRRICAHDLTDLPADEGYATQHASTELIRFRVDPIAGSLR